MSASLLPGERLAAAAQTFIGTPFRLHGRDPASGLDCIGLVAASLRAIGFCPEAPEGYLLRNVEPGRWLDCAERSGLARASGKVRAGDVALLRPGPGQHHVVIAAGPTSAIHAHAGLRRVVLQPMAFAPALVANWRLPAIEEIS